MAADSSKEDFNKSTETIKVMTIMPSFKFTMYFFWILIIRELVIPKNISATLYPLFFLYSP